MNTQHNYSLKNYNTFGIDVNANTFVALRNESDIKELIHSGLLRRYPFLILGGGSNIVFTQDYPGTVVHMESRGVTIHSVEGDTIYVEAQAGEQWAPFVCYCADQGWHGTENLAAIPGTVGAAPVQNVGAYGVEAKDIVHLVRAYDVQTGELRVFQNKECRFAYRNSIFKQELKGRYIVASVIFRLQREFQPDLEYKAIASALALRGYGHPTAQQFVETITAIRYAKLPKPEETGSAGSFFKNPIVTASMRDSLRTEYPDLVSFETDDGRFKLAAGWLIEHSGWKGKSLGSAGVYDKQALVLVNRGGCTGADVVRLAHAVEADVEAKFGVRLEPEAIIV